MDRLVDIFSILYVLLILITVIIIYISANFLKKINNSEKGLEGISKDPNSFSYNQVKQMMINSVVRSAQITAYTQKLLIMINRNYGMFTSTSIWIFISLLFATYLIIPNSQLFYQISKGIIDLISIIFAKELNMLLDDNSLYLYNMLELLNNSLGVLLSISITIYFFTYRVRRSISISSNYALQDNIPIFLLIFFTFVYGKIFSVFNADLFINSVGSMQILTWTILYIVSIQLWITHIVSNMMKSINFDYILGKATDNVDKITNILCYTQKYDKDLVDHLSSCISSVYQTLAISIEKNDGDSFRHYFKVWEKIITKFMQGNEKTHLKRYVPFGMLVSLSNDRSKTESNDWFVSFYNTLIDNHINLSTALYSKGKYELAGECLKLLNHLAPPKKEEELYRVYIAHMKQVTNMIDSDQPLILTTLVDILKDFSKENTEELYGVTIYNDLLLKAVHESDLKKVSLIAYSLISSCEIKKARTSKRVVGNMHNLYQVTSLQSSMTVEAEAKYKKAIIYTILQVALKSIELGHYNVTGFLVKMFVTKFHEYEFLILLDEVYKDFLSSELKKNPYYKNLFTIQGANPKFNLETIDYCTNKLTMLLYGQQKYALINKLPGQNSYVGPFCFRYFIPYYLTLKNCEYIEYLFNKIDKAKLKYGLIYLDDRDYLLSLKKDFNTL